MGFPSTRGWASLHPLFTTASWRTQRRLARRLPRQPVAPGGSSPVVAIGEPMGGSSRWRDRSGPPGLPAVPDHVTGVPAEGRPRSTVVDGVPREKAPSMVAVSLVASRLVFSLRAHPQTPHTARTTIRRGAGRNDQTGDWKTQRPGERPASSCCRGPLTWRHLWRVADRSPVAGSHRRRCSCPGQ